MSLEINNVPPPEDPIPLLGKKCIHADNSHLHFYLLLVTVGTKHNHAATGAVPALSVSISTLTSLCTLSNVSD